LLFKPYAMRNYLMIVALMAFYVPHAQKVKVSWSEESKKELEYGSLVQGNGLEMVKLCFETEGGLFSKKSVTPILSRYDHTLQEKGLKSFMVDQDGIKFDNLLSIKNNLFLFTNRYDRKEKTTTFYSQKIDNRTLNPIGKAASLGVMDAISRNSQSKVQYEVSKDSSKIMVFGLSPYSKKNNEKYYMAVYTNEMSKLWDNTVVLPYLDKFIDVLDYMVTNDGSVGVILKHYDKEIKRENVREDGARVPAYKTKLLLYAKGGDKPKEFVLNLQDKYVHAMQLTADINNNLTLFGLYKNKYDGYVSGYFVTMIDQKTMGIEVKKMEAFPADMLELVKKDKQGSDREKDPGLSSHFMLADVVERADGSIDYLLEYYKLVWRTRSSGNYVYSYPDYYYGDVIDIHVSSMAPTHFVRLPKWQHTPNTSLYSSFKAVSINNKLVLFYNDDRDNVERELEKKPDDMVKFDKSVLAMATIDQKNNLTRNVVYNHREMKLTTCINVSKRLSTSKIGLYALKGAGVFTAAKDMIGLLEVN
jgi:hypothetical protein